MSEPPHAPEPGKFWKLPFVWEPDCPPPLAPTLAFEPADEAWLPGAVAEVMRQNLDESIQFEVDRLGARGAADLLLQMAPADFDLVPGWWRMARQPDGQAVGFVLPVRFKGEKTWRAGQPEGTIFYIGVLPQFRGLGHGAQLLAEASRVFSQGNCWRGYCDTSCRNEPMIRAFRAAGYKERAPVQRNIA